MRGTSEVTISRAGAKLTFPARFTLVAAMSPCSCGRWRSRVRECKCSDGDVARYQARISGPLLDRIDLYVDVPSVVVSELRTNGDEQTSAAVRTRVVAARRRRRLGAATRLTSSAEATLARAARKMALSGRGISRCIGVARTIACLSGDDVTDKRHVSEALQYRVRSEKGGKLPGDGASEASRVA